MPIERSTVLPPFDVAQYARDSERRVATAEPLPLPGGLQPVAEDAPSEVRLSAHPPAERATDEEWAASMLGWVVVCVPPEMLRHLPLDHRAGFLLSRVEGEIDLDTLIAISAMPRDETLRVARSLYAFGVIDFR